MVPKQVDNSSLIPWQSAYLLSGNDLFQPTLDLVSLARMVPSLLHISLPLDRDADDVGEKLITFNHSGGYVVGQLVEALCYKLEGHGFDSQ
jgi:hypothetical protein